MMKGCVTIPICLVRVNSLRYKELNDITAPVLYRENQPVHEIVADREVEVLWILFNCFCNDNKTASSADQPLKLLSIVLNLFINAFDYLPLRLDFNVWSSTGGMRSLQFKITGTVIRVIHLLDL